MHNKSYFTQKNMKSIFIALYCLVPHRKNTKPSEKTKMPLGKLQMPKLCIFISEKSTDLKIMRFYQ